MLINQARNPGLKYFRRGIEPDSGIRGKRMSEEKQYADRDLMAMDIAGNHYCRHVSAMTREQLHSKSDVAAELGWRDMQIAELKAQRDALAAKGMELAREAAHIYEKYNATQMPDMDLIDFQTIQEFSDSSGGYILAWSYLNSVRAEGVEALATFAGQQYQQHAGDKAQQKKWKSMVFLCTQFAAQIRAGEPS